MKILCKHSDIMTSKTYKNKIVNEYIVYVVSDIGTPITADVVYGEDDRDLLIKKRYLKYFEEGSMISNVLEMVTHDEFTKKMKK